MKMAIEYTTEVDISALWEQVWSSDGAGITYWCSQIRDANGGDINLWTPELEPLPQNFKLYDFEEDKWHTVTLEGLAEAWVEARVQGLTHCGRYSLDDNDACVGDIILQIACFGEVIYG